MARRIKSLGVSLRRGNWAQRMRALTALFVAGLFVSLVVATPVYAVVKSDDTITVAASETLDDDLFAAGSEVIIDGIVTGDMYAAAETIIVNGEIWGDLIAVGSTITVNGVVRDDIRVAGDKIRLNGAEVGDSLTVAGNELTVNAGSSVAGGLIFGGRTLSLDGTVGRGVVGGGEDIALNNSVGRTVRVAADDLLIGSSAVIGGDLEYQSEREARINGQINGQITRGDGGFGPEIDVEGFLRVAAIGFGVWAFASATLIGLVMVLLMAWVFKRSEQVFASKPWQTAGWGALALFAGIPAVIVVMITIIGIPLGVVMLILWGLSIYFAKFFAAYAVGSRLLGLVRSKGVTNNRWLFLALLIGLVLYYVLRVIPILGGFVRFITTIVGMGMILALGQKAPAKKKGAKT